MLNEAELIILSSFFPEGRELTTMEIGKRCGYSHERVHSTLVSLAQKGVLSRKRVGKTLVYSVRKFDDEAFLAFAYGSIERKTRFIAKYPKAANAIGEFLKISKPRLSILFGSYSKGAATQESDIDILCVDGGKNSEKTALSLRHAHNLKIAPVMLKFSQFRRIRQDNPALWDDILKFGVLLNGRELFYDFVYR